MKKNLLMITLLSLGTTMLSVPANAAIGTKDSVSAATYQKTANPHRVDSLDKLEKVLDQVKGQKNQMTEDEAIAYTNGILRKAEEIFKLTHSEEARKDYLTQNGFIVYDPKPQQPSFYDSIMPDATGSDAGAITLGSPSWSYNYISGIWSVGASFAWVNDQGWYNDFMNGSLSGQDQFGIWFSNLSYSTIASGTLYTYWGDHSTSSTINYPNFTPTDGGTDLAVIYSGSDTTSYLPQYSGNFNGYFYSWDSGSVTLTMRSSFAGLTNARSSKSVFYHTSQSQSVTSVSVSTSGVGWGTTSTGYGWNAQSYTTSY